MSDKKFYKVIVTHEYVVEADSTREALQLYKWHNVWSDSDKNSYELTSEDLEKYGIQAALNAELKGGWE